MHKTTPKFFLLSAPSTSPKHLAGTDQDQSAGGRTWVMDLFGCMGYAKRIIGHLAASTKYQEFTTKKHKAYLPGPQNYKPGIFDTLQSSVV